MSWVLFAFRVVDWVGNRTPRSYIAKTGSMLQFTIKLSNVSVAL